MMASQVVAFEETEDFLKLVTQSSDDTSATEESYDSNSSVSSPSASDEGSPSAIEEFSEDTSVGSTAAPTELDVVDVVNVVDDSALVAQADALFQEEKILEAARVLRKAEGPLPEKYTNIIKLAEEFESAISDITGPPDASSGWTKRGESHGKWPTLVYNRLDKEMRLASRMETPIEASLLVPLLSVLNETDIYDTWCPSFKVPKVGLKESNLLDQAGRAEQTAQLLLDLPWPLKNREVIIHARAVDEIDAQGYIVVRLNTPTDESSLPPLRKGCQRIELDGAILCRACPADHELLIGRDESKEPLVLVSLKLQTSTSFKGVPMAFLNFVTKHFISGIWAKLLCVADDVRQGKRPQHEAAIKAKEELYEWVDERANVMLENLTSVASTSD